MATSIHFTLRSLVALRTGRLSAECNARKNVTVVVQELYMSLMLAFYNDWKVNERKVSDFDKVSKMLELEINTSEKCRTMIARWNRYIKKGRNHHIKKNEDEFQFAEIC